MIHIYAPPVERFFIKRLPCPTCQKDRFFTVFTYEWHGAFHTCLKCGEQWSGGEQLERPFCRGWRKENIRRTKEHYRRLIKAARVDTVKTVAK